MIDADAAPGSLELVRAVLNTWLIPNDTRVATDRLPDLRRDPGEWNAQLAGLPRPSADSVLDELIGVRDGLRRIVERRNPAEAGGQWLQREFSAHPVMPQIVVGDKEMTVHHAAVDPHDPAAVVLGAVADAVAAATWSRLKACPDCRWVFYDNSRSGTKVWCGMNANGPNGRACGSIAKVRAYRQRKAATASGAS